MQTTKIDRTPRKLDCRQTVFSTQTVAMKITNPEKALKANTNHFKQVLKYVLCDFPACIIWHTNNDGSCNKHKKKEI